MYLGKDTVTLLTVNGNSKIYTNLDFSENPFWLINHQNIKDDFGRLTQHAEHYTQYTWHTHTHTPVSTFAFNKKFACLHINLTNNNINNIMVLQYSLCFSLLWALCIPGNYKKCWSKQQQHHINQLLQQLTL